MPAGFRVNPATCRFTTLSRLKMDFLPSVAQPQFCQFASKQAPEVGCMVSLILTSVPQ